MNGLQLRIVSRTVRRAVANWPAQFAIACFTVCLVALPIAGSLAQPLARDPAVVVRNGPVPGSLEIMASEPVLLAPELMVERLREDGSFEPVRNLDLGAMRLVAACNQPVHACIEVDRRGLRPKPWTGMSCSAQCNGDCDGNVRFHGQYRFVVTTCDHTIRFEGPVFTWA